MKKTVKILVFLSFVILWVVAGPGTAFSSPQKADGKKWISYAIDEEGIEYFYSPKSVLTMPFNVVRVLVKTVYSEKQSKYREAELLWEIDCSKKSLRGISAKAILKNGKPVDLTKPSSWSDIPAGSTAESLHEIVCTKDKKKK